MVLGSLLSMSLYVIANNASSLRYNLQLLPPNVKLKLVHILSKRGKLENQHLSSCLHQNIRELELTDCNLNDESMIKIANICKYLVKIDLNAIKESQENISSRSIQYLAEKCKFLRVVYLRRCLKMNDDCVTALARNCLQLIELNLSGCHLITDKSLEALGEFSSQLRSLNLSHTKVTDSGIYTLVSGAPRNTLKELNLSNCTLITDEAIEAVVQYCQKISIFPFVDCPMLTERSRVALDELLHSNNSKCKQLMWTIY